MQIKVLLFGQLKDIIGKDTENLELQTGSRLSDLMAHYASQFSKFKPMAGSIACSVKGLSAIIAGEGGHYTLIMNPMSPWPSMRWRNYLKKHLRDLRYAMCA